jgi:HPt (histidine-containing phosphotransfer) domain-containing protein
MDGYLTKPVPLSDLRAVIDQYIAVRAPSEITPVAAPPMSPVVAEPVTDPQNPSRLIHLSVLRQIVGDETEVILDLLADFQRSAQVMARELCEAHDAGDLSRMAAVAHKLKSTSRSMGATRFGDLCEELEQAGHARDAAMVAVHRRTFDEMLAAVDAELTTLLVAEGLMAGRDGG